MIDMQSTIFKFIHTKMKGNVAHLNVWHISINAEVKCSNFLKDYFVHYLKLSFDRLYSVEGLIKGILKELFCSQTSRSFSLICSCLFVRVKNDIRRNRQAIFVKPNNVLSILVLIPQLCNILSKQAYVNGTTFPVILPILKPLLSSLSNEFLSTLFCSWNDGGMSTSIYVGMRGTELLWKLSLPCDITFHRNWFIYNRTFGCCRLVNIRI